MFVAEQFGNKLSVANIFFFIEEISLKFYFFDTFRQKGDDKVNEEIAELEGSNFTQGNVKRVGFQLKSLDLMFRRHMESNIRKNGFEGMSVINVWILDYLSCNEDKNIFQKDIEKRFNIGKSSIAGTLKVMEEKGVIVRMPVEGDARLKRVCLTEKGKEYASKMDEGRDEMEHKVSEGISEDDMEHFFRIIHKMQENLKSEK